jgi:hypothetical protein
MTTRTRAAALIAALAFTATLATAASEAQARPRWGAAGFGIGFAAGTMIGAAAASNGYVEPVYAEPAYRCRLVDRFDRWGNYLGTRKVCDVY